MNISWRTASAAAWSAPLSSSAQALDAHALFVAQLGEQHVERVDVARGRGILDAFAPFHLLHQERRLHRGVVLRADVDAAQRSR
jgi:hypothetical protein